MSYVYILICYFYWPSANYTLIWLSRTAVLHMSRMCLRITHQWWWATQYCLQYACSTFVESQVQNLGSNWHNLSGPKYCWIKSSLTIRILIQRRLFPNSNLIAIFINPSNNNVTQCYCHFRMLLMNTYQILLWHSPL